MKYCRGILALVILVFSFVELSFSKWVIVAAAGLIVIRSIFEIFKIGCCSKDKCSISVDDAHATFSEFIMEKAKSGAEPSREEVEEVLSKIAAGTPVVVEKPAVSEPVVEEATIEPVMSEKPVVKKAVKKAPAKKKAVKKKAPVKKKASAKKKPVKKKK